MEAVDHHGSVRSDGSNLSVGTIDIGAKVKTVSLPGQSVIVIYINVQYDDDATWTLRKLETKQSDKLIDAELHQDHAFPKYKLLEKMRRVTDFWLPIHSKRDGQGS
jgi:hypothetical protein